MKPVNSVPLKSGALCRIVYPMDIGKIIAEQRGRLNLSQRALARKAGVSQATLSSIERGGEVKPTTARSILSALDMDIEVVPIRDAKNSLIAERQREIKRVQEHFKKRRSELQSLLSDLPQRQIHHVREINQKTNMGYLAELWNDFLELDRASMQSKLEDERYKGMAWQSLLQANPFIVAGIGTWSRQSKPN